MAKVFNTTAVCIPDEHYMVNLDRRLEEIKKMVDGRKYFTINRARQYGKTTTIHALRRYLKRDYYVVSMDFQTFGNAEFKDEAAFSLAFAETFADAMKDLEISGGKLKEAVECLEEQAGSMNAHFSLRNLFRHLKIICKASDKPIVLIIDEVDSAANNQVFLDFLAQLRAYYMERAEQPVFWSVILAGVYDVRNLQLKIRSEEEHKVNSPWNIAAEFKVDMSFSKEDIAGMLKEYEADHHTGMDIDEIAGLIYDQTSGYPFLVSRLCQIMDEDVSRNRQSQREAWTLDGFMEASSILTSEKNTLFDSLIGKIMTYPKLNRILQNKIFKGETVSYNISTQEIDLAAMFGIIKNAGGVVVPANKIFAKVLTDYYLSQDEIKSLEIYKVSSRDKNQFIENGKLNMKLVLEKFIEAFTDLYAHKGRTFIEEEGKKYFLLFLRPIINATGFYSLEAVTGNNTRTDVIVYYHEELYIIETKIWHGQKANEEAEEQLLSYMKSYRQDKGYLLTFNFNKTKTQGIREIAVGKKTLIEAVV